MSTGWANADWKLSDRVKLTTGVRYTEDTQEYRGCSHDFNGDMLPNVNVVNRALYLQNYGVFAAPISEGECNTFDPVAGEFGEVVSTLDEDNVSWRVALDFAPADGTLLYTSISKGAKAGPFVSLAESVSVKEQNAKEFNELIDQALAIDVDAQPEHRLANTVMQRRAQRLKAAAEDLFLGPEG